MAFVPVPDFPDFLGASGTQKFGAVPVTARVVGGSVAGNCTPLSYWPNNKNALGHLTRFLFYPLRLLALTKDGRNLGLQKVGAPRGAGRYGRLAADPRLRQGESFRFIQIWVG